MRAEGFHHTLLIAGSRKFSHSDSMHRAMDRIMTYALKTWGISSVADHFLYGLSGAAKGADALGEAWAKRNGLPVQRFEPSPVLGVPDRYHARNELMAAHVPHVVLLFWRTEDVEDVRDLLWSRENNRGTLDMFRRAEKHRTRQWVYHALHRPILMAVDEGRGMIREIPFPTTRGEKQ